MKVRVTGIPKMAYGGPTADSGMRNGFPNRTLNTSWNWKTGTSFNDDDSYTQQNTLQPVDRELADIEAEKGESIIGDFDGDGQQEHMKVGGERHSNGGTPLNVPEQAFVYSDTKALKIKDPAVLARFGGKAPSTPAALAKQYDLNKWKAIIDNPKSDILSRKTAQMMYDNSLNKLNQLAQVQEGMKGNMQQQQMMKFGGIPQMKGGGNGYYPITAHRGAKGTTWSDEQLQEGATDIGYPNDPNGQGFGQWLNSTHPDLVNYVNTKLGKPNTYTQDNPIGSEWGLRHQYAIERGMDQQLDYLPNRPMNITPPVVQGPDPNNLQSDNTPVANLGTIPAGSGNNANVHKGKFPQFNGIDANTLGDLAFGLKAATTKNYAPWEAPARAVLPSVTFESDQPIRNAISEQANAISNNLGLSANSRAARAAYQGLQGQVGSQAATAVGEVGNRNCVSDDTEILTANGWCKVDNLCIGDSIFTVNQNTLSVEIQPCSAIHIHDINEDVVEINNTGISCISTKEHRWLVQNRRGNTSMVYSKDLSDYRGVHGIYVSGKAGDFDGCNKWTDEEVKLIGLVLTDGSYGTNSPNQVLVSQSKLKNIDTIDSVFNNLGKHGHNVYSRKKLPFNATSVLDQHTWQIGGEIGRKIRTELPNKRLTMQFLLQLSTNQLRLLYDYMLIGDGCYKASIKRVQKICCGKREDAEAFTMLCAMIGQPCMIKSTDPRKYNKFAKDHWKICWWVYLRRYKKVCANRGKKNVKYKGRVWCPTVENGTWIAKRNDTVFITGNSAIANQGQMQASQIMNQQSANEQQRLTRLYDKGVIGAQQYKNSLDNLSNELVGRAAERQDSRYKNAWDDIRSKYFTHDANGMPVFKSDYAKATYEKEILGMHPGESTATIATAWKQAYDNARAQGIPEDSAKDIADHTSGVDSKKRTRYDANNQVKGYETTQRFGGPIMKMGGAIPQYSIGGDYLPSVASIDTVQPVVAPATQHPHYDNNAPEKGQAPLYAANFLISKGIPAHVAAGIVGNIAQESGFNPNITNSIGAFGLGQWLGKRKQNYMKAAMNAGVDPGNMDFQLNYLITEPGESKKALMAAMNTPDPQSAAITWADTYERMGKAEANYPKRAKVAQGVFNALPQGVLAQQPPMKMGGSVRVRVTGLPS